MNDDNIQPDRKEDWPFFCDRCKRGFRTAQGKSRHDRTVHNPDRPKSKFTEAQRDRALRRADQLRRERWAAGRTSRNTIPKSKYWRKERRKMLAHNQNLAPKIARSANSNDADAAFGRAFAAYWKELHD
jgi:hypothetical protein